MYPWVSLSTHKYSQVLLIIPDYSQSFIFVLYYFQFPLYYADCSKAHQKDTQMDAWALQMAPKVTTFGTPKPLLGQSDKNTTKMTQTGAHWDPKNISEITRNVKKTVQKLILDTDAKKVPIWNPPDLQNYGFRARGASIFTSSRGSQNGS